MNPFYSGDSRTLAERIEVTTGGISVELDPPLEVKHGVQYVTLAVPSANLWDRGAEGGALLMPDGEPIGLTVDLEAVSGKRFELRSVSFGKELMFSHLASDPTGQASDLPVAERFNRLHLKSDRSLIVDQVRWVDVTNK